MQEYLSKTTDIWVNPDERVLEGVLSSEQKAVLDRGVFKGLFYILKKEYLLNIPKIMAVYNRMTHLENVLYFGAFRHHEFGNTTEVGIAIKMKDIYEIILEKFVLPYKK
jgi:hypothetical protein